MDINQLKLNKTEWNNIEIPISENERDILKIICLGYHNIELKYNKYLSLFGFLKVEYSVVMENYLFIHYFQAKIKSFQTKYGFMYQE